MQRKAKAVLIGAGLLTLAGLGWRASRAKAVPPPAPPEGQIAAIITLEILDAEGNPVPRNSAAILFAGSTYVLRATVTNTTVYTGTTTPAPANVQMNIRVEVEVYGVWTSVITPIITGADFAAGESKTWQAAFTVSPGWIGMPGFADCSVGIIVGGVIQQVASGYANFNVAAPSVTYGFIVDVKLG